jgi:molybdenum cofactor cytidylyltransferase
MGTNKMLLHLDGESLVRRTVRIALKGGLEPVIVVIGHEAEAVTAAVADLPCETVLNPDFEGPTSTSLHLALERLPSEIGAAVILLGDMVFTTPEMVRSLIAAAESSGALILASRYGEVHAPPLLFRRALFPELLAWTGEGCGKAVVRRHLAEVHFLDWGEAALADVDTPEEYARARETIEREATSRSPDSR